MNLPLGGTECRPEIGAKRDVSSLLFGRLVDMNAFEIRQQLVDDYSIYVHASLTSEMRASASAFRTPWLPGSFGQTRWFNSIPPSSLASQSRPCRPTSTPSRMWPNLP